ncbi:MAG: class I SAM-dependent methyltransferase [Nocardia sp.]|nr:class I SAM-dependent methyltransferase [Nocardia sp.]
MSLAQHVIHHPLFALIYERIWRPLTFFSVSGRTPRADRIDAERTLRLRSARTLLDIGCGPGNFTLYLSRRLGSGAHAIGLDFSVPMLEQARADNVGPGVSYVRADARRLPFPDGGFDAVCCFGSLYLIEDPMVAAGEMIRVLAPGGRISISTSYRRPGWFGRMITAYFSRLGLRFFDAEEFPKLFADAGLVEVEHQVHGLLQYLSATRPVAA